VSRCSEKMYYVAGIIRTKEALSRCDQKKLPMSVPCYGV